MVLIINTTHNNVYTLTKNRSTFSITILIYVHWKHIVRIILGRALLFGKCLLSFLSYVPNYEMSSSVFFRRKWCTFTTIYCYLSFIIHWIQNKSIEKKHSLLVKLWTKSFIRFEVRKLLFLTKYENVDLISQKNRLFWRVLLPLNVSLNYFEIPCKSLFSVMS